MLLNEGMQTRIKLPHTSYPTFNNQFPVVVDMATEIEATLSPLNMNPVWKFSPWPESFFCYFPINNYKASVSGAINQETLQKDTEIK